MDNGWRLYVKMLLYYTGLATAPNLKQLEDEMESEIENETPETAEKTTADFLAEISAKYETQLESVRNELSETKNELEQTRRAFNNLIDNRQSAVAVDGTMAGIKKLLK